MIGIAVGRRAFVVRPVDKHRATNDKLARDKTPIAAVFAVLRLSPMTKYLFVGYD